MKKALTDAEEGMLFQILGEARENNWANIFNQAVADRPWLKSLGLAPGRWAAGYPMLYFLFRALADFPVTSVLEFGLGESTKLISAIIQNERNDCRHLVLEDSGDWHRQVSPGLRLSPNTSVMLSPLETKEHEGVNYHGYANLGTITGPFDLFVVDGPAGEARFSRYDICELASNFAEGKEFIVAMDDVNREGENETFDALAHILSEKNIAFEKEYFHGTKSMGAIATPKFRFVLSI